MEATLHGFALHKLRHGEMNWIAEDLKRAAKETAEMLKSRRFWELLIKGV